MDFIIFIMDLNGFFNGLGGRTRRTKQTRKGQERSGSGCLGWTGKELLPNTVSYVRKCCREARDRRFQPPADLMPWWIEEFPEQWFITFIYIYIYICVCVTVWLWAFSYFLIVIVWAVLNPVSHYIILAFWFLTGFQTSDDLFQDEPSQTSFSFQCVLIVPRLHGIV